MRNHQGELNPRFSHGHKLEAGASPTYGSWQGMRTRCLNPSAGRYADYGGRGIQVCARWSRFENFLADMGERPEGLSLERKDTNSDYTPGNCVWATPTEQARNQRTNRLITFEGRTQCLSAWAEELGTNSSALWKRLKRRGNMRVAK